MDKSIEQQLTVLLDNHMSGSISASDMERFRLLITVSSDEQLAEVLEEKWESFNSEMQLNINNSKKILHHILSHNRQAPVTEIKPQASAGKRWGWWLAAASVILLIGISVPFLRKAETAEDLASKHGLVNDVLPGHNGAILTLADGSSVLLDSLSDGLITAQGNTSVSINKGRLEYDASKKSSQVLYNTMTTPKGRQFELMLPDGSMVWLNAASSITYPTSFSGGERRVSINGEAYFEVAKDAKRPFKVKVNNVSEVEVLGTHFNVNGYADDGNIKTTLLEGSVKVSAANTNSLVIKPGQQAIYAASDNNQKAIRLVNNPDTEQVMAWKNGLFNFNHTDLKAVLAQLSRWYDIGIRYEADVPDMEFGGEITRDLKLSQALFILKRSGVGFRIENNTLVVTN